MRDGSAGSVDETEAHTPPGHLRYVVLKEEFERETLVGGAREPGESVADDVFLSAKEREARPRLEARHEVAIEAEAYARGVGDGVELGIVGDAQIVDGVRDKVGDVLVEYAMCSGIPLPEKSM